MKASLLGSAGGALAMGASGKVTAQPEAGGRKVQPGTKAQLPMGKIGTMSVSRMLLGGNLLTHFTHSRDLRYVYTLTAQYNTEEKILETMAEAEAHGINTVVIHTAPRVMYLLKKYRQEWGGKIQWIICTTAPIEKGLEAYRKSVREIVEDGADAVYLWGVKGDQLAGEGKIELMREAVDVVRDFGVPTGVGGHDLRVIEACEKAKIAADFYIKTLHHHKYPTAPRPEEIKGAVAEIPGYWCEDPDAVVKVMQRVEKPWIAFKVMAAGAIPPADAFKYAFESGADHVLAGMFDFEIAEDVRIAKATLAKAKRNRPWRS